MNKCIYVIDTSSILNLDAVCLGGKDVLRILRINYDIAVCDFIPQEFRRNRKYSHTDSKYWYRFLRSKLVNPSCSYTPEDLASEFYTSPPSQFTEKDAGERGNAFLTVDMLLNSHFGQIVFVTDDAHARRSFINNIAEVLPGMRIWDSFDLFLDLAYRLALLSNITLDDCERGIRDINASMHQASSNKAIDSLNENLKRGRKLFPLLKNWR